MPPSRIGFTFFPDDRHYTQADLEAWLPVLESLHCGWLVLQASVERAVPEPFIRGLVEAGIAPIVRVRTLVRALRHPEMEPLLRSYGRWGVQYVSVFDPPNLRSAWFRPEGWGRSGLVDRFVDICLPVWEAQRAAGLMPVFPPLEPGGDYWDTAFLEAALERVGRRGQSGLVAELTLGVFSWTYGRPLDWGRGGPDRWPEARPYHTPDGAQDQRGLRLFEWYQAVAQRTGAGTLPVIVLAGGGRPGEYSTDEAYAEANASIGRLLLEGAIPDYVKNFAFHTLAAAAGDPERAAAWFDMPASPRSAANALRALVAASPPAAKAAPRRRIPHFVLLPPGDTDWGGLSEFALAFRPTIGFSEADAAQAEHVTLLSDENEWSQSAEAALRAAGCSVQRLSPSALPAAVSRRRMRASRPGKIQHGRPQAAAEGGSGPKGPSAGRKTGLRGLLEGVIHG